MRSVSRRPQSTPPPHPTFCLCVVAVVVVNEPTVVVVEANEPTVAVVGANEPTVAVVGANEPTVVVVDANGPTVVVVDANEPTVVVVDANEPTVVVVEANGPTVAVVGANEPTVVVADEEPTGAEDVSAAAMAGGASITAFRSTLMPPTTAITAIVPITVAVSIGTAFVLITGVIEIPIIMAA